MVVVVVGVFVPSEFQNFTTSMNLRGAKKVREHDRLDYIDFVWIFHGLAATCTILMGDFSFLLCSTERSSTDRRIVTGCKLIEVGYVNQIKIHTARWNFVFSRVICTGFHDFFRFK